MIGRALLMSVVFGLSINVFAKNQIVCKTQSQPSTSCQGYMDVACVAVNEPEDVAHLQATTLKSTAYLKSNLCGETAQNNPELERLTSEAIEMCVQKLDEFQCASPDLTQTCSEIILPPVEGSKFSCKKFWSTNKHGKKQRQKLAQAQGVISCSKQCNLGLPLGGQPPAGFSCKTPGGDSP